MLTSAEIRGKFLSYFQKNGHVVMPSSSLIPRDDATLFFTNAGMVPFKKIFLGQEKSSYARVTTVQRCMRVSGKHNDLENVGFTARHHTFFEMLGNFSFGDYFKREAIQYAWEFLTKELGIPAEKLWITVYEKDDEAAKIWLEEIGIDKQRFSRCGEESNFWAMGETGPCGPCSEIFYDHGSHIAGGPPGSPDEDGDRYVEIWNLVFMQYNRDEVGKMNVLPKPSVDTGMGLERVAAVMQGVHSNYDTDIFKSLIKSISALTQCHDANQPSLRVIADHIRASAFLIADGVFPSNEGRGYVLRRIIRRAIRHGNRLGMTKPFFYCLVSPLVKLMGKAYSELVASQSQVEKVLKQEEELFAKTLKQGLKILEDEIQALELHDKKIIPGHTVFKLYDTYGFPVDLTNVIAKEKGFMIDEIGFDQAMKQQRERSQARSQFKSGYQMPLSLHVASKFIGYDSLESKAKVIALFEEGNHVAALSEKQQGLVVLDQTPFYAESGGQMGDRGWINFPHGRFIVEDVKKYADAILHIGYVEEGKLKQGISVDAVVNEETRRATSLNHSATHLLHEALVNVLGEHVQQGGSSVDAERLRFDFTHHQSLSRQELQQVEVIVNEQIRKNELIETTITTVDHAIKRGAKALFDEKYGDQVRMLSMGDFSVELCGGTHAMRTGDIGLFKIVSEESIAAGIRRIEAVTGEKAFLFIQNEEETLKKIASLLKVSLDGVLTRIENILSQEANLQKTINQMRQELAKEAGESLYQEAKEISGVYVLAKIIEHADVNVLRKLVDQLKDKLGCAVVILATIKEDNSIQMVAGVTKNCVPRFHAGELISFVSQQVGGKGGGRPDMAQGGGCLPDRLLEALRSVEDWINRQ